LKIDPVVNLAQVEVMRLIYNESLTDLSTRPLPYRTSEEQVDWWYNQNRNKVRAWLHYDEGEDHYYRLLGFSMLTDRGRFSTPVFAIRKEEHGKGYARYFIEHYLDASPGPLGGAQLRANKAIVHLNKVYGWEISSSQDGVDYLLHPNNESGVIELEAWEDILEYHERMKNELQS
jgi:GNAT superfamily N-acetyltransferase